MAATMAEVKKDAPLSEKDVRRIVREELGGLARWKHDVDHSASAAQRAAQAARDAEAGAGNN